MNPRRAALEHLAATGSAEGLNPRTVASLEKKGHIRQEAGKWILTKRGEAMKAGKLGNAANLAPQWDRMKDSRHATKKHEGGGKTRRTRKDQAADRKDHEAAQEATAKAAKREREKEARHLGKIIGTHALKIAKGDGTAFTSEDLLGLEEAGWTVRAAGTAPAKVGEPLGAVAPLEVNPGPLGPTGEARALVLTSPEPLTEAQAWTWRRAGYDIAPAPLRYRRAVNPAKDGPESEVYHLLVKAARRGDAPTAADLSDHLVREHFLWGQTPEQVGAILKRLEAQGLAHRATEGLFGDGWAPGAGAAPGLFVNPSGRLITLQRELEALGQLVQDAEGMWWLGHYHSRYPRELIEGRALQTLAEQRRELERDKAAVLRAYRQAGEPAALPVGSPLAKRETELSEKERHVYRQDAPGADTQPAPPPQPGTMKKRSSNPSPSGPLPAGKLDSATFKVKFNPSSLAEVWEKWTGSPAGAAMRLELEDAENLPAQLVLLGRLSGYITPTGQARVFTDGPYLCTDEAMERVWVLSPDPAKTYTIRADIEMLCYLARKPKFGDRGVTEYVHLHTTPARLNLRGRVGTLTGDFRLTARGIEG